MGWTSRLKTLTKTNFKTSTSEQKLTEKESQARFENLDFRVYYSDNGSALYKEYSEDCSLKFCENDTILGRCELRTLNPVYNVAIRMSFVGENALKKEKGRKIIEKDRLMNTVPGYRKITDDEYYIEHFLKKTVYLFGSGDNGSNDDNTVVNGLTEGRHVFPFKINLSQFDKSRLLDSVWFLNGHVRYTLCFEILINNRVVSSLTNDLKIISAATENKPLSFTKKISSKDSMYKFVLRTNKKTYYPNNFIDATIGLKLIDPLVTQPTGSLLISNVGIIATFCRLITITEPDTPPRRYKQKISQTFSPIVFNKNMFTKESISLKCDNDCEYMPTVTSLFFSIAYYIEVNLSFENFDRIKTYNNETIRLTAFVDDPNLSVNIDPTVLSYKVKEDLLEKRSVTDYVKDDLQMVFFQNFLKPNNGSLTIMAEVAVKNQISKEESDVEFIEPAFVETNPKGLDLYDAFLVKTDLSDADLEEDAPDF